MDPRLRAGPRPHRRLGPRFPRLRSPPPASCPHYGYPPWDALYWPTTIYLALFVHRVEGVAPGLYLLVRDPTGEDLLKKAMRETVLWETPAGVADRFSSLPVNGEGFPRRLANLELPSGHRRGWFFQPRHDSRVCRADAEKRGLVLPEPVLGGGHVRPDPVSGAEAAGVRSTGMGCYFDEPVHQVLGLAENQFQSLYHFTVGVPLKDHRLRTWPPYSARSRKRDANSRS